jgi:fatty-acyl-CoA synthase
VKRIDPVAFHASRRGDKPACVDLETGRRWSYADLDREVNAAASWLTSQLGPASGARVATLARNSVSLLIVHLACVRAGAIYTPLNWRLTVAELAALIRDAEPALLIQNAEFVTPAFTGQLIPMDECEARIASATPTQVIARSADDASTLLYTSGTSGTPKGVMITEENVFWGGTNFNMGNDVSPDSVLLCDMPMFHTAGLFAAVRAPLLAGAAVLISRGFDPERTLARLADPALAISHYFSVPQMAQSLWQQPGFRPEVLQRLAVYAMGGAPNPRAQIERFVRAGIRMSDGFGMSETGSNFGMPVHDLQLLLAKAGSCGLPYIAMQARITDERGDEVGDNEAGELWLRGPSISPGYWNKPQLTREAFHESWFRTGDAAMRDSDGFYYVIDRRKDMYISGGENVYPAEVEAVLCELEAVAEAAVIGIADERWGEVGRAYIVAAPGRALEAEAVLQHCRSRLAKFKMPASVVLVDSIPRTASGKIQKGALRTRAKEEISARR